MFIEIVHGLLVVIIIAAIIAAIKKAREDND
jgi:hypothetical protein